MKINKKKWKISKIFLMIFLAAFAIIQIFPLYWLITFSLKDNGEIFTTNPLGLPNIWRWENYSFVLNEGGLIHCFVNSLIYAGVSVVVSGLVSSMASYAIVRLKWKFSKVTMAYFSVGIMIPLSAALLPLFLVLDKIKLIDTYLALIIPYTAFSIPLSILILSGFYASIPKELEEAAYIDGCGIYGIFFRIIMPIIKPALATVSIFSFLGNWNELMFANTLVNSSKYKTLTVGIMSFSGQFTTQWGQIGAGMVIATIPTVIIYLFLSDQVQSSLVAGAVKG
jgi:raffinose/stachyose/melibiose transport system permease protein